MSTWRTPPEPIPAGQIKESFDSDIVVVGLGHSGTSALRAAAEEGVGVIGIEYMPEDRFLTFGRDIGHINSEFLASRGVPKVDYIEFFNEWMRRSGNRANPPLVMKFTRNGGESFDWYTDSYGISGMSSDVRVAFWPTGKRFDGELSGYKFWPGTAQFPEERGLKGTPTLTDLARSNQAKARGLGARLFFGIEAMQLVKDGARVAGVIGRDKDGNYYRYNGRKGVILAAGDFAGNSEMVGELATDIKDLLLESEELKKRGGRSGRGIQMGVWAGALKPARSPR